MCIYIELELVAEVEVSVGNADEDERMLRNKYTATST